MCLGSNFALQGMSDLSRMLTMNKETNNLEIKLVMAAVYSNYTTSIVDDEGIEQDFAFIARPRGRKLLLRFTAVDE